MKYTIYCHTHRASGKKYVGMTKRTVEERWKSHLKEAFGGASYLFHRAIRKYGPNEFSAVVLEVVDMLSQANEAEMKWIAHWRTTERQFGYNIEAGGRCHGTAASTRKKLANVARKRWNRMTAEERSAVNKRTAAKMTDEARAVMAARMRKRMAAISVEQRADNARRAAAVAAECITPAQRSIWAHKGGAANAARPKEALQQSIRKGLETLGSDGRVARSRKGHANQSDVTREEAKCRLQSAQTREERLANLKKARAAFSSLPRELRSEMVRKGRAAMTQEQRSAIAKKGHEARRQKKKLSAEAA